MTIEMMIDVVAAAIAQIDGNPDGFQGRPNGFRGHEAVLLQTLNGRRIEKDARSWKAIAKRLWRMKKASVFAEIQQERINVDEMLVPGRISIVDLSDKDAPYLRNLVIAQILRALQMRQDELYTERENALRANKEPKPLTRVNIFIEEAHEFLSAQRIKQMPNLFDQVARIARRGRKRYLGLVFVTQLPSHLPDEVLGLVNNWILHKLTDTGVVNRLRKVVPGVSEASWNSLPNLAPGQALCSFTHLARPVMTTVDPSPCQLRMVD
jgi:DNA helicase HerA-like ATPase